MFAGGKVNAMVSSPRGHYLVIAVQEQISIYQVSYREGGGIGLYIILVLKVNAMVSSPRGHYLVIAVQEQISIYQVSGREGGVIEG